LNGETPDAKGVYTMLTPDKQKQVMAEILKAWQLKPNHPTAREMWLKLGWRKWDGTEKIADYAKAVRLPPTLSVDVGDGVMLDANLIPAAMFTMGSAENELGHTTAENQHLVHLSKPFYMSKYEITQEVYEKVMGAQANKSEFKGPKHPEDRVSWPDAENFCKALSAKIKKPVRLPTEAEWEFACRAGSTTLFHFGDSITSTLANIYGKSPVNGEKGEYRGKTMPVGSFQPNAFGLFDMHGNCWEWVSDWRADYPVNPTVDPQGPEKGSIKVLRGGSWYSKGLSCRTANRDGDKPTDAGTHYGFRVVIDLSK
jgi:formylglycine-generating enzyme required for sulfatase activity